MVLKIQSIDRVHCLLRWWTPVNSGINRGKDSIRTSKQYKFTLNFSPQESVFLRAFILLPKLPIVKVVFKATYEMLALEPSENKA
jgi:hypothetical protein